MRVGAADAKGTNAVAPAWFTARPVELAAYDVKWGILQVEAGVRAQKMRRRRNHSVPECEGGLDETGHTRSGGSMADVALYRAKTAILQPGTVIARGECLPSSLDFDRVPNRGRRTVRLDILNRTGIYSRIGERVAYTVCLSGNAWRGE